MYQPQTYQGVEAVDRLAELGLSTEQLIRTIQRAYAEAATCTDLDPVGTRGTLLWARMTRFLREELIPSGWVARRPKNQELTLHFDRGFKLLVVGGDKGTGRADRNPQSKNPKGPTFYQAVVDNQASFDFGPEFEGPDEYVEPAVLESLQTWMVLYRVTKGGKLFLEVSLPDEASPAGQVSWAERIIVEVPDAGAPIGGMVQPDDDDLEPYRLTVERLG